MTPSIQQIFADSTYWQLSSLIGLVLFFLVVGLRELSDDRPEGYLYLVIATFLGIAHAVVLENALGCDPRIPILAHLNVWEWLVVLAAPALIALFFFRSFISLVTAAMREALVKLFFGLTLLCLLYLIGASWPTDVRGMLTIIWGAFLFKTEIAIAN